MRQQSSTPPTSPSVPLCPLPDAIPAELRALRQWVCWRFKRQEGEPKPKKAPYNPETGRLADPTDPATWRGLAAAWRAYQARGYNGIGLVLTATLGLVFVDLDRCRDPETGAITDRARAIVTALDSYTEISASGTGLHILTWGELTGHWHKRDGVEIYWADQYAALTGHILPGCKGEIAAANGALTRLYASLGPQPSAGAEYTGNGKPSGGHVADVDEREIAAAIRAKAASQTEPDRSTRFQGLVAFTRIRFGEQAVRAHAALIEELSGEKYGPRLQRELERSLTKVWARDGDQIRPGVVGRSRDALSARAERTAACQAGSSAAIAAQLAGVDEAAAGAGAATPPVLDELARLRAEVARLQAENAALTRKARRYDVLRGELNRCKRGNHRQGEEPAPLRSSADAMALMVSWEESYYPGEDPPETLRPVYLPLVAAKAGMGRNSASRHLQSLTDQGLVSYTTDPAGPPGDPRRRSKILPLRIPAATERTTAPAPSAAELRRREASRRCEACGSDNLRVERRTEARVTCEDCGVVASGPTSPALSAHGPLRRVPGPPAPQADPPSPGDASPPTPPVPPAAANGHARNSAADQHRGGGVGAAALETIAPKQCSSVGTTAPKQCSSGEALPGEQLAGELAPAPAPAPAGDVLHTVCPHFAPTLPQAAAAGGQGRGAVKPPSNRLSPPQASWAVRALPKNAPNPAEPEGP